MVQDQDLQLFWEEVDLVFYLIVKATRAVKLPLSWLLGEVKKRTFETYSFALA